MRKILRTSTLFALGALVISSCSAITGEDSDETTDLTTLASAQAYVTRYTPTNLAIEFPSTLASQSSTALALTNEGGDGGVGAAMDGSNAQGFYLLKDSVRDVVRQIKDMQQHLLEIDGWYVAMESHCGSETSCEVPEGIACTVFTYEMAANLVQSLGEDADAWWEQEERAYIEGQVGQEVCNPALTFVRNTLDDEGYSFGVEMNFSEDDQLSFYWSEDRSRIKSSQSWQHDMNDPYAPPMPDGEQIEMFSEGSTVTTFNTQTLKFSSVESFVEQFGPESHSGRHVIRAQGVSGDAERARKETIVEGSHEFAGKDFEHKHAFKAKASNDGGLLRQQSEDHMRIPSNITISGGDLEEGLDYAVVARGADPDDIHRFFQSEYGRIHRAGNDIYGFFHRDVPSDLAELEIFAMRIKEDGKDEVERTSFQLTNIDIATEVHKFNFDEAWDANGQLIYFCFKEDGKNNCEGASFGDDNGQFEDDDLKDDDQPEFRVNADRSDISDQEGFVYPELFLSFKDLHSYEPHTHEMHEALVGHIFYEGEPDGSNFNAELFKVEYHADPERVESVGVWTVQHPHQWNGDKPRMFKLGNVEIRR